MIAAGYAGSSTDVAPVRRMAEMIRSWRAALAAAAAAFSSAVVGTTRCWLRRIGQLLWRTSGSHPTGPRPAGARPARNLCPEVRGESLVVSAAQRSRAWSPSAGIVGERDALFLPVRAAPGFCPNRHPEVLEHLQTPALAKLFDMTQAQEVGVETFTNLAAAWTAPATAAPRLGILISFERWATLRDAALAALQPLAERGIRLQVFYEEQAWGGQLDAWFRYGTVVHNLPAAIARLGRHWEPSASWPIVIDTLARLVRMHSYPAEVPALLTEVAELALSCGGDDRAAMLAHEALFYLGEIPGVATSKSFRVLGAAHMAQGRIEAAMKMLDRAIAMAALVNAPAIEASALCQNGLIALNHGDYVNAERRFRRAIDLLAPSPQLLAVTHHHLALALMFQGSREAEHHARTALALRGDPKSHLAEADRILLAKLRATAHLRSND
jgi:tetratricopeptide (TPR) repeat protein